MRNPEKLRNFGRGQETREKRGEKTRRKTYVIRGIFNYLDKHERELRKEITEVKEEEKLKLIAKAENIQSLKEKFRQGIVPKELREMIEKTPTRQEQYWIKVKEEEKVKYEKLKEKWAETEKELLKVELKLDELSRKLDSASGEGKKKLESQIRELVELKKKYEAQNKEDRKNVESSLRRLEKMASKISGETAKREFWLEVLPEVSPEEIIKVLGFKSIEEIIRERKREEKKIKEIEATLPIRNEIKKWIENTPLSEEVKLKLLEESLKLCEQIKSFPLSKKEKGKLSLILACDKVLCAIPRRIWQILGLGKVNIKILSMARKITGIERREPLQRVGTMCELIERSEKVAEKAKEILDLYKEKYPNDYSRSSPIITAAAAVYIAVQLYGEPISKVKIDEFFGVTPPTLTKKIKDIVGKLGTEFLGLKFISGIG